MDAIEAEPLATALAAIAAGDRGALAELCRLTAPRLLGVALRVLRRQDAAEDVLHEAYLSVWQRAAQYSADRGQAWAWLAMIVRNRAIDRLRQESRRGEEELASEDATPDVLVMDDVSMRGMTADISRCLGGLPGDHRRAILLAAQYGLSHDEIARRLGRPLGTVKSWIRRGLADLRECLEA
ncbi:MAG: sigma-70 family RNA polymerase sigma factor [Alphaproteobacteria bacterium]|nr:sigma-70 family RNA polymerase sigma factor [Alphaproteobacteria bacterium]